MTKEQEERFDARVETIISLWKKHFGEHMQPCSDCGGFMIHVCETALREMLGANLKRMDETIHEVEKEAYERGYRKGRDNQEIEDNESNTNL